MRLFLTAFAVAASLCVVQTQARAALPLKQSVEQAYPQLDWLFQKLVKEKNQLRMDGVAPFESHDKFLPGKSPPAWPTCWYTSPRTTRACPRMLRDYGDIADLTVRMDNETWGIYYYIGALYKLKQAGLLERAVRPATLEALRKKLDWRTFVRQPAFELIDLPTNYYGVAFSIARLRMLMGWEDQRAGEVLLERMLTHYAGTPAATAFPTKPMARAASTATASCWPPRSASASSRPASKSRPN
jgi:hypothetical protein